MLKIQEYPAHFSFFEWLFFIQLESATKYDNRQSFLKKLKEAGEQTTEEWLQVNGDKLGKQPSCDIEALFD
ncbi:hypothetical protein [Glaciecola sp. 1036]|uniref:hypothetical protein n=1 Tax=Alteromonadaceae TaxID=72275 RepID=UPI003D00F937